MTAVVNRHNPMFKIFPVFLIAQSFSELSPA
jgi:hypothetical protein